MIRRSIAAILLTGAAALSPSAPAPAAATFVKYAALGDSVASGHGLNTSRQDTCRRSADGAYPDVVKADLGLDAAHYRKYACSGDTSDVLLATQVSKANDFLGEDPTLVTLTVGADDYQFAFWQVYLAAFAPRAYPTFARLRDGTSTILRRNIHTALDQLGKGHPHRTIAVTTYYNPFNAKSVIYTALPLRCDQTWLGRPPCHQIMTDTVNALNNAIKGAVADYTGTAQDATVKLVDGVGAAFAGYEGPRPFCGDADPTFSHTYIQAKATRRLNLLLFPRNGDDCFHPNRDGQNKIAKLVNAAVVPATARWIAGPAMLSGHGNPAMTVLPDGRVLVVSGSDSPGHLTATAELYDPATRRWTATGVVSQPRDGFRHPVVIGGGKVLIAAGTNEHATFDYDSAEVYDPATGQWTTTGSVATSRRNGVLLALHDGRALIATGAHGLPDGNRFLNSAELYDPATGQWTPTGSLQARREGAAGVVLRDGRAMVVGGFACCDTWLPVTELYDPASGTWSRVGDLPSGRAGATLVLLNDGKVLIVGGTDASGTPLTEALLFDPATGRWTPTGNMRLARNSAQAVAMSDGRVMVAGGGPLPTEIYDPATGTFALDAPLALAHPGAAMIPLASGELLIAGGGIGPDGGPNTEIYTTRP
ncbi:kelch repeat-containing protein [Acrocarpospora sp. B8E8]|uniref:kelch repeat-containing protein n=1 Tax=Acrocarpospora sp. B8E8 TaxID=3153572 RepID=UPI00325F75B1